MKNGAFLIYYDKNLLVVLTDFKMFGTPMPHEVLDWYAENYAFERKKLTGRYTDSLISVKDMKYEDFFKKEDK